MMETNGKMVNNDLNDLIYKLKNEDERYAGISKRLQIVYWVLVPIYLVFITRDIIVKSSVTDIIGSFCFLFGMIAFALLFRHHYREYKYVDYAQPTLIMLKNAVRRYQPYSKQLWIVLLGLLLLDAGLSLHSIFDSDLLTIQLIYWGAMIGAVLIGLAIWQVRYRPIRDEALRLIREMEG